MVVTKERARALAWADVAQDYVFVMDTREPLDKEAWRGLGSVASRFHVCSAYLPEGDYWVVERASYNNACVNGQVQADRLAPLHVIERKTIADLKESTISGRVYDQLIRVRKTHPDAKAWLLVEMPLAQYADAKQVALMHSVLASVACELDVAYFPATGDIRTWLPRFEKSFFQGQSCLDNITSRAQARIYKRHGVDKNDVFASQLRVIPKIGKQAVAAILRHAPTYKTLAAHVAARAGTPERLALFKTWGVQKGPALAVMEHMLHIDGI